MPTFTILLESGRFNVFAEKPANHMSPELLCPLIPIYNAHFPSPRKHFPNLMRDFHANAEPAIAANDEEFCHIPDVLVIGYFRPPSHEDKASWMTVNHDEKWMTIRLSPI